MDTYINKLAPWEERNEYYEKVKLGKRVSDQKTILSEQTQEMIKSQIARADEIILSRDRQADVINEIGYDIKSVGQGLGGLQAAFEWGISDVVWFIEKDTEEYLNIMRSMYVAPDKQKEALRFKAEGAYAKGNMDDALEYFTEFESFILNDFSVCISLGMIYLFYKVDKEKALEYFDRAIKYARPLSHYYTAYALLYKALIKRDFGFIEEAEECTKEVLTLLPDFAEAMYQCAQYNALLGRPGEAVTLLRKAIKNDIVYCFKIMGEQDFETIDSEITEMFEEIRKEKNEKVKEAIVEEKKNVILINNAVTGIGKLGYQVPNDSYIDIFQNEDNEIDKMVKNNSIFDAHIANIMLSQLSGKLKQKKELLRTRGNKIYQEIDSKIQELSAGMAGKKKGGAVSFLLHFLSGQIIALPFGWYIGIPPGIVITESILLVICFYVNVIMPQSQWKEVYATQSEQEKLLRIMKKL